MAKSSTRVLVADDFEPFRRFVCATLQNKLELLTIIEAADGVQAIEMAQAMQPELILLDIGLPKVNGIEAARRIRAVASQSKILFVSQESSVDVAQAAFSAGASGYVAKMDAGSELLIAVKAVLRGERFVGSRFAGHGFTGPLDLRPAGSARGDQVVAPLRQQTVETVRRHEVGFYSDDACLLDNFTRFAGTALKAGKSVIVVATELHRSSLLLRLQSHGLDIGAAIEEGRYISLDVAATLSKFMIDGQADPVRFLKTTSDLIAAAAKAAKGERPQVAACGECAPFLWEQGNAEAAIRIEHLWDEIAKSHEVDVLCGYFLDRFQGGTSSRIFAKICAEHSAVHAW